MALMKLGQSLMTRMDPETAHGLTIKALKSGLVPANASAPDARICMTLRHSGLVLRSPVGLAAGFDKNAEVPGPMSRFGFGFVECGTVTPEPQPGNPKPRLFRLREDRAVINRMGFNNDGLEPFIGNLQRYSGHVPVGANVGANKLTEDKIADYELGIRAVYPVCNYITINISSPNTPGLRGLQDKDSLRALLTRCGSALERIRTEHAGIADRPVFLKLAPDLDEEAVRDISAVVRVEGAWLSGLIVSNTTLERPDTLQSPHKGEMGGLSGAPLFDLSTRVLAMFARELGERFDLIGAGGIANAHQAYAKIRAGAQAVQLYSALVYEGIELPQQINEGLIQCLEQDGLSSLEEAVGADL